MFHLIYIFFNFILLPGIVFLIVFGSIKKKRNDANSKPKKPEIDTYSFNGSSTKTTGNADINSVEQTTYICEYCGAKVKSSMKKCQNCGASIVKEKK